MDNTERETHDFMNVDSFSQLPFIRPAPPSKEKSIRLFGKEFGDAPESDSTKSETLITNSNNVNASEHGRNKDDDDNNNNTENGESSRRFECHYCCRNFPTSQALGGHQNAHKRERQHAKRHLHSAMVQSSLSDANMYGFMNYRFGSTAMSHPTWNTNSSSAMIANTTGGGRFYGSSYSHQLQPINGSPLGLWRIPTATHTDHVLSNPIFNSERSLHPLPLFAGEEIMSARMGSSRVGPSGSQSRYVSDSKPSVNDHVSLDLHL